MTIKEKLSEYWDAGKEMQELEIKINNAYYKNKRVEAVESSRKTFPYTKGSFKLESFELDTEKHLKISLDILKNRYNRLLQLREEVEKIIDEMPTSRLRRIFTYRYIDRYSWVKVARLIGGNATSDSVKKEHARYLKQI